MCLCLCWLVLVCFFLCFFLCFLMVCVVCLFCMVYLIVVVSSVFRFLNCFSVACVVFERLR